MVKLAILAALLVAGAARAAVGLTVLPAHDDTPQVTIFYPSTDAASAVQRGPFTLSLAENAPPTTGNHRLVMLSHGSGANPWVNSDLARALVNAGFVVAMPEHHADNTRDPSNPGPDSWKLRPGEVSRAIDAVLRDPRFGPLVAPDHVGVYGMSAGGHTALSFAGGRWSPSEFARHCEAHIAEDFPSCVGLMTRLRGDAFDDVKMSVAVRVIRHRFDDRTWYTHDDPRVRAVVAGVPAAADFDPASLANPRVPLGLVIADGDKWLAPRFHGGRVLQACLPRCELVAEIKDGGHGALLSPPPPASVLGSIETELIGDPPGFDRGQMPAVDERIVAFFRAHLLP